MFLLKYLLIFDRCNFSMMDGSVNHFVPTTLLREKDNIKQLIRYIVEEPPEGAKKQKTFKFPFIACEIFSCEVDLILKALVEDEELMDLLFSFLDPKWSHSALLAGCFNKCGNIFGVWTKTNSILEKKSRTWNQEEVDKLLFRIFHQFPVFLCLLVRKATPLMNYIRTC